MAGPKLHSVRQPAVAGSFYPAEPAECRAAAAALVKVPQGPGPIAPGKGGIVPHAGWICSGAIAGEVLGILARDPAPDVIVVFGAVHTPIELAVAALASFESWILPGGGFEAALDLNEALRRSSDLFVTDDRFHSRDHAVEVELPLIRVVWPNSRLLAVEVPLVESAAEIGRRTARAVLDRGMNAIFLASSDLTHYGPSYQFAPAGVGMQGLNWAKQNDRRLLQLIKNFEIDQIVREVRGHFNACGGGAIAAMLAACKEAGASIARVHTHASSYETLARVAPQPPTNAVGYAAVVVR